MWHTLAMAGKSSVTSADVQLKVQRVETIRGLRASGAWRHARDTVRLAAEWGLHRETVARYAAEAGRLIAGELGDTSEVRATVIERLTRIIADGSDKDAINASRELAILTAAATPTVDLRTQLLGLSVGERRAWLTRQAEIIAGILAELPAEVVE